MLYGRSRGALLSAQPRRKGKSMSEAVAPVPTFPADSPPTAGPRRLRLWPGVVLVVLQAGLIYLPEWLMPGTVGQFMLKFWGTIACSAGVLLWWLLGSRLRWA